MALRVRVCAADDVPEGDAVAFDVPGVGHPILVIHTGGTYYACSSICPHEDVSLEGGDIDGTRIECPGHGYRFDATTGRCDHDPNLVLPRYRVSVHDGDIYVDLITGTRS